MTASQQQITDPALPHLGTTLDAALMRGVFADELFASEELRQHHQVRDCEIIQARYKPGKNCLVSYRLMIRGELTDQTCEQILCARIYETGGSRPRFIKAQSQSLVTPRFGDPIFHIPGLEMVVWNFPNDRKLTGLPKITNTDCLKNEILPPVIAAAYGAGWEIAALTNEIVHYVAEHTCTVRVTLELRHATTSETRSVVLYGKTYYNDEGAETYARMRQLWQSEARLGMAQPLAYQAEIKTLWQAGLHGASLYEQEGDGQRFLALLKRAAVAVAALHQSPVSSSRRIGIADLFARFGEVERMVALSRPESLSKLRVLIDCLKRQSPQLSERPTATLHGDLHLKNFFVNDQEVALIDLDNVCLGDPLQELGSFVASLYYRELSQEGPIQQGSIQLAQQKADAFICAYAEGVEWEVSDSILRWHTAAALIAERAYRCITRLKTGGLTILDDIIALAGRIVEASPQGADPRNDFVSFTDPENVKTILQGRLPALAQGDLVITECRILHLYYKTYLKPESGGKSFLAAAYQLGIGNRMTGTQQTQIIFAKVFSGDRSHEEVNKSARQHLCPTAFGVPLIHLDDLGMVIWTFPNDPGLRALPEVADPDKVKNYFPYDSLPSGVSAKEIASVKVEIVNYRPEIRCTTRYRLDCGSRALTLFGKAFASGGEEIYQRMAHLWQRSRQRPSEFPMPRPLAYNDEVKTIWQEELPGKPLAEIINRGNYRELIAQAARRLVFIHQSDAPTSTRITMKEHLEEIEKKVAKLNQAFPEMQPWLQRTAQTLAQSLTHLSFAPELLIHGDFHLRQLMVHNGQVALFDFDEFAIGDPAQDLANFVADLHSQPSDGGLAKAIGATLIEAYSQENGWRVPADRLAWHSGIQFVTRAYRAWLQQKPGLEKKVRDFVMLAYQFVSAETLI